MTTVDPSIKLFTESLEGALVIQRGDYEYFVHPVSDGVPRSDPRVLDAIASWMTERISPDVERIVTIEAMGIPMATLISARTGIPFTLIRKRPYGLKGERLVKQSTGYSHNDLYINSMEPGMKIAIVDDVVSTGGSLKAIVPALREMGVEVLDVLIAIEKGDNRPRLEQELSLSIKTMVKVKVENGSLKVIGVNP